MIKGVLRLLSGICFLVAVMAATNDVTRSIAAGEAVPPLSTYEHWSRLAPVTLDLARRSVESKVHPLVWDLGLVRVLQLPAWGLFGGLGLLFAFAGRRRREINIFAN